MTSHKYVKKVVLQGSADWVPSDWRILAQNRAEEELSPLSHHFLICNTG